VASSGGRSSGDSKILPGACYASRLEQKRSEDPMRGLVASASVSVNAKLEAVWNALTDPAKIKQYMFGTEVVSGWREGSSIVWKGAWQGKTYEDTGHILKFEPMKTLQYSHFSPSLGKPDAPENRRIVTLQVMNDGMQTTLSMTQDNNPTEQARLCAENKWRMMLEGLKKLLEAD
jgi:uncharacterized protein YndB with AHSA1/START domain